MSHETKNRHPQQPLLPQQTDQMSNFTFAPQSGGAYQQQPRETQKNYVFVDEHNRHKRLKVMRACEGCRRRKIKCDAATTNTWPCSACVRTKIPCVRPNGYDGSTNDSQYYDAQQYATYDPSSQTGVNAQVTMPPPQTSSQIQPQMMTTASPQKLSATAPAMYGPSPTTYTDASGALYSQVSYSDPNPNLNYTTVAPSMSIIDQTYSAQNVFHTPPSLQGASQSASPIDLYAQSQYQSEDLSDLLGNLKMDPEGTAPFINHRMLAKSAGTDDPLGGGDDDDYHSSLPPLVAGPGSKIRIPPELMPDDSTVLHYFDLFFTHVHPYVPVLNKDALYHQWQNDRGSISPLLLEAIFAIGGNLADDPGQGQQWLALVTRHADSFMDVPRLSTLQALLIVIKAREAAPKKGYYYRSWMAVVQCVQMGIDLELDEHYSDHQAGKSCGSDQEECMLKTRLWQVIFVVELMVGSPQGRHDLKVTVDSVDLRVPSLSTGFGEKEYHISRNFTYFTRIVANVSTMNRVYSRIRKQKDWANDPEFTKLNPTFHSWQNELPSDLAISFPQDGSVPWLQSPFVGNLNSYHYLSVIMLHRPQLELLNPHNADGQWKHHMMVCYSSAKLLCKVEEAMIQQFGITGLQCMQRGVNFTIYSILTCIVLHLVCLTSPDPELNTDAREYFSRHMRILEKCSTAWPMPEMQKQIDAVREAFSADTRKPFMLKPSFPYGSPHPGALRTPPGGERVYQSNMARSGGFDPHINTSLPPHSQVSLASHPITPPVSAGPTDVDSEPSPSAQSLIMMAGQNSQASAMQTHMPLADAPPVWNPSRIFDQWNTTFGTPSAQSTSKPTPQTPVLSVPPTGAAELPTLQDVQTVHASLPQGIHPAPPPNMSVAQVPNFVTPAMWQESVASVYEGGLKRAWDYDSTAMPLTQRH